MVKKPDGNAEAAIVRITCPACESVISSDGRELHDKSVKLTQLLETADGIGEVNTALETAEKKIEELTQEVKTLKEKGKVHVLEPPKESRDAELE